LIHKGEAYLKLFPEYKKSYPGVIDLIKDLSENYTLGLASSATRAEIDLITKEFGIDSYFKVVVSAEDVAQGKPNPEPYLKAASLLKVSPDECVVIEDAIDGVKAAKSAGCMCIRVATTHPKGLATNADRTVDSFEEIAEVIEQFSQ
ncbi:HAD-IA family hydrolase, partial [Candidatus Woesebacteria bacterium]|nr:HAD-IA family hydrolase [Candidatus Woesebacteria bacterium]